jgi:plasmid stability protein
LQGPGSNAIIIDSIGDFRQMGQVLVRNLDDDVIERLKRKAESKGHSLEQELREIITAAAPLSAEEKLALIRQLRSLVPPVKNFDVRAAIRVGRDDEFE